jgi:hypothetical protein
MTQKRNSKRSLSATVGIAMLIVGSAVLMTYSTVMAWQFHAALNNIAIDSLGCFGSIALASLHVVRIVTLDRALLLSVVHRILILFSAFVVMLIGIALLPRRTAKLSAHGRRGVPALPEGDQ